MTNMIDTLTSLRHTGHCGTGLRLYFQVWNQILLTIENSCSIQRPPRPQLTCSGSPLAPCSPPGGGWWWPRSWWRPTSGPGPTPPLYSSIPKWLRSLMATRRDSSVHLRAYTCRTKSCYITFSCQISYWQIWLRLVSKEVWFAEFRGERAR